MDILLKQDIDKNNFNVFIRDLSSSLNTNLKHIIEDTLKKDIPEIPENVRKNIQFLPATTMDDVIKHSFAKKFKSKKKPATKKPRKRTPSSKQPSISQLN